MASDRYAEFLPTILDWIRQRRVDAAAAIAHVDHNRLVGLAIVGDPTTSQRRCRGEGFKVEA
jgi:hypothetical protein